MVLARTWAWLCQITPTSSRELPLQMIAHIERSLTSSDRLYGPNHQPRGGSLYSYGEIWARYAVASIVELIERDAKAMEVKKNVFDEYQTRLDEGNKKIIWESAGSSYYVNGHGRQAVNMPWTTAEYHPMIIKPKFDDFNFSQ